MEISIAHTKYDFSDRKKMRGAWFVLLINSYWLPSPEVAHYVCYQIRELQEYFPCAQCKKHFGEHLRSNPPEEAARFPDGLFNWVIDFMTAVNLRIGKPGYKRAVLAQQFATDSFTSKDPLYNFNNPRKLRGAWLVMLSNSCRAETIPAAKIFCNQVRNLCDCFPVATDQQFFSNYLSQHPPEDHIYEVKGMFVWTVAYMNAYRKNRGKEEYERYILYREFNEPGFNTCHECGS